MIVPVASSTTSKPAAPTISCGASSQTCEANGCSGTFANGKGSCASQTQNGCACIPTKSTLGFTCSSQSCDANNCQGSFNSDGTATCKAFGAGCTCTATSQMCGNPQSCDLNGCAGELCTFMRMILCLWFVGSFDSNGKATCKGGFAGCQCTPTTKTCGNSQSCDLNGCAGTFRPRVERK